MEAIGINAGYFLIQVIAFVVIYTLLTRFAFDPLVNMLNARKERIARGLEDAAVAAKAREEAEAEAETILQNAQAEVQQLLDGARSQGEQLVQSIEAEARESAVSIREESRISAEAERNAQLSEMRGQVSAIAIAVAQRLIGESLDEQRQHALIEDFFSKVPADARTMSSGAIDVISAMPLTNQEQERVQQETGADAIEFKVDPSILGGLIIRSQDRVVDGSIRNNLEELSGRFS
ncbi:MAG: F0F1 ATP synthase subunit B [Chloroflexi bacterium]|nr:F0F1 ATP synthase subunit B [Anaerolineaceae bacterium]MCY4106597.1 F0F1 ATP synthase subunit B [Chloroflexota bacterium]